MSDEKIIYKTEIELINELVDMFFANRKKPIATRLGSIINLKFNDELEYNLSLDVYAKFKKELNARRTILYFLKTSNEDFKKEFQT